MTEFINAEKTRKAKGKKTVFTKYLNSNGSFAEIHREPKNYVKVVYLGKCTFDGDMFAAHHEDGHIEIFKGEKGDEFND